MTASAQRVEAQQAAFPQVVGAAPQVWLLYLPDVDPDGALLAAIRARYREADRHAYPLLTVYRFTTVRSGP